MIIFTTTIYKTHFDFTENKSPLVVWVPGIVCYGQFSGKLFSGKCFPEKLEIKTKTYIQLLKTILPNQFYGKLPIAYDPRGKLRDKYKSILWKSHSDHHCKRIFSQMHQFVNVWKLTNPSPRNDVKINGTCLNIPRERLIKFCDVEFALWPLWGINRLRLIIVRG